MELHIVKYKGEDEVYALTSPPTKECSYHRHIIAEEITLPFDESIYEMFDLKKTEDIIKDLVIHGTSYIQIKNKNPLTDPNEVYRIKNISHDETK